jgi:hypothetical protein
MLIIYQDPIRRDQYASTTVASAQGADSRMADVDGFRWLKCDDEFPDVEHLGVKERRVEGTLRVFRVCHALVRMVEQEVLGAICQVLADPRNRLRTPIVALLSTRR